MDKRILETILSGQREKLSQRQPATYLHREATESLVDVDSAIVPQVITGVWGVGKTVMACMLLEKAGARYGYINFDDPRLATLEEHDLGDVIEVLYKITGEFDHILFDEFYRLPQWIDAVEALMARGFKVTATVSGCQYQMASIESRINEVYLFPFDFEDVCRHRGIDPRGRSTMAVATLRALFDEYLRRGGLPAMTSSVRYRRYLDDIVATSLRHTMERTSTIANNEEFVRLADYVLERSPIALSYRRVADDFTVRSEHTIKKYISLIKRSGILAGLHKIAFRDKQRIVGEKLYAIDPALSHFSPKRLSPSVLERSMATVVHLYLMRNLPSDYVIHYYADRTIECDFVICRDSQMKLGIQVCYDATDERHLRSKVGGLLSLSRVTGCTDLLILTDCQQRDMEVQGQRIAMRPAYEFLLEPLPLQQS